MEIRNTQLPPPPPSAISALIAGFNLVANHAVVLILPILLDLFLWLGPRFSFYTLIAPALDEMAQMPNQSPELLANMNFVHEFFASFNAFSALRTFPLGIFSLMSGSLGTVSPLGERAIMETSGLAGFALWMLLLTGVGWVLGSLYFFNVAQIVAPENNGRPSLGFAIFQSLLLSAFWAITWLVISLPTLIFMGVLLLINPAIASLVYLLVALVVLWLAMPVFFSGHGIFIKSNHLFRSISNSFRLMRYALPSLGWFVVLALVLSQGFTFLWRIPPSDSWLTLLGIFGHAFISTALLAASFIYYRDLNLWVDAALQWMHKRANNSAQA